MSDSFLSYWRNLEAIIPVKVEFVEAGLASVLPRTADRPSHGHDQASSLDHRDSPQLPRSCQDIRLRGGHPVPRRDDAICHGRKLVFSITLTRTHKFVTSIL